MRPAVQIQQTVTSPCKRRVGNMKKEVKNLARKNYRKSLLERQQHDTAVKVRKMTDEQLCVFIEEIGNQNNSLE